MPSPSGPQRAAATDDGAARKALGLRLVNLEIRSMVPEREAFDPDEWDFLCECGTCSDQVRLLPNDFDCLVAQEQRILAPGHIFRTAAGTQRKAATLHKESNSSARSDRPEPSLSSQAIETSGS
jgi:hypothetical protein